jgi:NAD-dependent DNA ligase
MEDDKIRLEELKDILEKIERGIINLEFSKITDEEVEQLSNKLDSMSGEEKELELLNTIDTYDIKQPKLKALLLKHREVMLSIRKNNIKKEIG